MTFIDYSYPSTLESLVTRIATLKLKIAAVRRRKSRDYDHPDVSINAGIGVSHLHMLDALLENLDLDIDIGSQLETVPNRPGIFKSSDPQLDRQAAEKEGTLVFCSLFETILFLEELIERITALFDQADRDRETERLQGEAAYNFGEDCRMEASRRQAGSGLR